MKGKQMHKRGSTLEVKTDLQNKLIWMICAAMAMPTVVLGGSMYWMMARMSSPTGGAPPHEVIADVIRYVAVLYPLLSAALLYWVFRGTNKLVGPIERIIRELGQRIEGSKSGPIVLRPGDPLNLLADKINLLLQKRENPKEG